MSFSDRYRLYTGKSGLRWLVRDGRGAGDHVYVEAGSGSLGFAGATLPFTLMDGSELKLVGPWHSNSRALFEDTGVDVRDRHLTRVTIGLGRNWPDLTDILYSEPEFAETEWDAGEEIAQALANHLGRAVQLKVERAGGTSWAMIEPKGEPNGK